MRRKYKVFWSVTSDYGEFIWYSKSTKQWDTIANHNTSISSHASFYGYNAARKAKHMADKLKERYPDNLIILESHTHSSYRIWDVT